MEFQSIYPFTTEDIAGYFSKLNIKNKKVLTVGSSCDQALNLLLLGAQKVTIFDKNENVSDFYTAKKELILNSSLEELYQRVLKLKDFKYTEEIFSYNALKNMNPYMSSEDNYELLKNIIRNEEINILTGDINNIKNNKLLENDYDLIILSNVMQYIKNEEVFSIYQNLCEYLKEDGIIQLYYLYGSMYPQYFSKVINQFLNNGVLLEKTSCDNSNDSIILTRKLK